MDGRVSTDGGHPATVGPPRRRPTAPLVSLSVAGPPLPFPPRPPSAPRGQLLGWSCMEDLLGDRCQCLAVTQLPRGGRRPPRPGLWNRTDLGWIPSSLLTLGKLSVRGGPVCLRVKRTPPVPWHFGAVRSVACGAGRPAELCPQRTAGAAAAALLDEALPWDRGGEAAWHGDQGVLPTLATGDEPGQVGLRGAARAVTP